MVKNSLIYLLKCKKNHYFISVAKIIKGISYRIHMPATNYEELEISYCGK